MTMPLDPTHATHRRSLVESANEPDCDFPIQNLPFGVFRRSGTSDTPRIGVAIGDELIDVTAALEAGCLGELDAPTAHALQHATLNEFMGLGATSWCQARRAIADCLDASSKSLTDAGTRSRVLIERSGVEMLMPAEIGDYTDFYCSIHHATNVGSMFRPDNPLLPNYMHLPIGYHGRASSIVASGAPVQRPFGQTVGPDGPPPMHGPVKLLDYELEMGFFTGPGNAMGEPIPMAKAGEHIFGMTVVNDWSARDVQKWEYQPLGPFNAKNFATTISPWVVTLDALAPYRIDGPRRPADHPPVLEYLQPVDPFGLDITVEVHVTSALMRERGLEPVRVSHGSFADMYWTIAQMLVHHTSTGCNMRPGDLIASGTISGPEESARGCLLERTWRGQHPIDLTDGTQRKFLQDEDEVIIRAWCERDGAARVGFGECRGVVAPAAVPAMV